MRLFTRRNRADDGWNADSPGEFRSGVDAAIEEVFGEGKQTVLYYMAVKYGLSLEEAGANPLRLEEVMTSLFGKTGWVVVKRRLIEKTSAGRSDGADIGTVQDASLQSSLGFVLGLGALAHQTPRQ